MTETNEKPKFEQFTLMNLPGTGLVFDTPRIGPTNFKGLRENDYDEGYRIPTMPELVPLVHASLENKKEYKTAKNVIKTLKNWLTGNTGILYVPKGMFVQDNPKLKDGRISMKQRALESKLGSHQERGVKFSDDGSVRFAPYRFKTEFQTPLELSINKGIIALVGGEENAEKLAKASEYYNFKPNFWVLEDDVNFPKTRVAVLGSHPLGTHLIVNANYKEDFGSGYSFGIFEGVENIASQKSEK